MLDWWVPKIARMSNQTIIWKGTVPKMTIEPKTVKILQDGIAIEWEDHHTSLYPHRSLRLQCRCAECVGEWPNPKQLKEESIPQDVYAVEYQTVGRYALQFLWSDLHYTGIYPYSVLLESCPCPVCAKQK